MKQSRGKNYWLKYNAWGWWESNVGEDSLPQGQFILPTLVAVLGPRRGLQEEVAGGREQRSL